IQIYKPPKFKSVRRIFRTQRNVSSKLWFVSGLRLIDPKADRERLEALESEAENDLTDPKRHEVRWIRYSRKVRVYQQIQKNNWLIDCMWVNKRRKEVGPPSRVIAKRKYTSSSGKVYYMLMLESLIEGESIPFRKFQQMTARSMP